MRGSRSEEEEEAEAVSSDLTDEDDDDGEASNDGSDSEEREEEAFEAVVKRCDVVAETLRRALSDVIEVRGSQGQDGSESRLAAVALSPASRKRKKKKLGQDDEAETKNQVVTYCEMHDLMPDGLALKQYVEGMMRWEEERREEV